MKRGKDATECHDWHIQNNKYRLSSARVVTKKQKVNRKGREGIKKKTRIMSYNLEITKILTVTGLLSTETCPFL